MTAVGSHRHNSQPAVTLTLTNFVIPPLPTFVIPNRFSGEESAFLGG
jgi:hypothetical protein